MAWSDKPEVLTSRKSDLDVRDVGFLPGDTEPTENTKVEVQQLNLCFLTSTGNVIRFRVAPANTKRALYEIDYASEKDKVVDLFGYIFGAPERIRVNPRNALAWWLEDLDGRRR